MTFWLSKKDDFPTNSLRALQIGGGLLSATLARRLQAEFCHKIVCRYGSTETGIVAYADAKALTAHDGAVGFVAPWARVEVLDESGAPLAPGQDGELRVRTDTLAKPWQRGMGTSMRATLVRSGRHRHGGRTRHDVCARALQQRAQRWRGESPCRARGSFSRRAAELREAGVFSIVGASGLEEIWAVIAGDDVDAELCAQR